MDSYDAQCVVIGAGVVGLACAARLARSGREVLLLERNGRIGEEVSARNSEVIHAGIYYQPGSLKARLCVTGKQQLYRYCRDRQIDARKTGKLIVACDEGDKAALHELLDTGRRNGVHDLQWLDAPASRTLEPALQCVGAILSPSTGIVDSHGLMLSLLGDLEDRGGVLSLHSAVSAIRQKDKRYTLQVRCDGEDLQINCREVVNCAGLDGVAIATGTSGSGGRELPAGYFTKGNYFRFSGKVPFSRLIYPAPVMGGLGVHLTLDSGGHARFGPDVEAVEDAHGSLDVDAKRAEGFYASIRRYWPALPDHSLQPDYAGIRPKIRWSQDGNSNAMVDFAILDRQYHGQPGLVHCLGIESPGLTSSLAIADYVAERL